MRSSRERALFRGLTILAAAALLLAGCDKSSPTEPNMLAAATPTPTPTPLPPGGSIAGAWTGTWIANISGCGPLPAQAAFEQDNSIVRGTLTTSSTSCGLGGTFLGTLQGNTFSGSFIDDDFFFQLSAAGILSGGSLDLTINGGASVIGQLRLHR